MGGNPGRRSHDMVVPLLALPEAHPRIQALRERGIVVRRAQTLEMNLVCEFVGRHWADWPDGVRTTFSGSPVRTVIATVEGAPVGFAAYDIDYLGLFGPTGVDPSRRGEGIGAALLLRCLEAMREAGYLYAVIGAVGPSGFYTGVSGALSLPLEWPNYTDPDLA